MINIDTAKVKSIAGEIVKINNRCRDDFSAVEQAVNRLKDDWQQPQNVASSAFACFDEIKAKYFEATVQERQGLAQYLCDAVGLKYEEVEKGNKSILEGLFDIISDKSTVVSGDRSADSNDNTKANVYDEEIQNRMDSAGTIYNNSRIPDGDYIENGCIITSITNMYRRQQVLDGKEATVTKKDVKRLNGGNVSMSWSNTSSAMEKEYGYRFDNINGKLEGGNITISDIDRLLIENPSGVLLYAGNKGSNNQHAILLTSGSNGKYMVVDPIKGGNPIPYEECYTYKSGVTSWRGKSIEEVLNICFLVAYIK